MIISNNKFNRTFEDIICCPITLNPNSKGIIINNPDLESGELLRESRIKSEYPFFLSKRDFYKDIGKIKLEIAQKVVEDIRKLVQLS